MNSREEDVQRCQAAVNQLMEHFDTVQIFVTRHEPVEEDGTLTFNYGGGNWYARFGQVSEWVAANDERTRARVRSEDQTL